MSFWRDWYWDFNRKKWFWKNEALTTIGIFQEYFKQNITIAMLRKASSHSVDICRLIKFQSCKRKPKRKIGSNFNVS